MAYNDSLKPLAWLFGKWSGEEGKGKYPTIDDFCYGEVVEFSPIGMQPNIEYKFWSHSCDTKKPMHRETGFIKVHPDSGTIAFVVAHNFGLVEILEGEIPKETELSVTSNSNGRISFCKDPKVVKTTRTLKLTDDKLEHVMEMQTDRTDLTEHLRCVYSKQ